MRIEEPAHENDQEKFVNEGAAKKFSLISKSKSFIKEKGFHHLESKTIANKGWRAQCQPPRPAVTMVVQEFYANLAANVLKKVRVQVMLEDFSAKSINEFYSLESVNFDAYDRLQETPNFPEVLRLLTNG